MAPRFEIYLKATRQSGEDTPDEVKTSLLLHAIGSDGQEVYDTFSFIEGEEREKYAVVLKKFEQFYIPKNQRHLRRLPFLHTSAGTGRKSRSFRHCLA